MVMGVFSWKKSVLGWCDALYWRHVVGRKTPRPCPPSLCPSRISGTLLQGPPCLPERQLQTSHVIQSQSVGTWGVQEWIPKFLVRFRKRGPSQKQEEVRSQRGNRKRGDGERRPSRTGHEQCPRLGTPGGNKLISRDTSPQRSQKEASRRDYK